MKLGAMNDHLQSFVREAWRDGYQTAVKVLRELGEASPDAYTSEIVHRFANLLDAVKPQP